MYVCPLESLFVCGGDILQEGGQQQGTNTMGA